MVLYGLLSLLIPVYMEYAWSSSWQCGAVWYSVNTYCDAYVLQGAVRLYIV